MLDDFVALALKIAGEVRHFLCGGDGDEATRLECLIGGGEPFFIVHKELAAGAERGVIEVQEDGVEATGVFVQGTGAGIWLDGDAGIGERAFREKLAVPLEQIAAVVCDGIDGALLRELCDDGFQHVAEADADEPNARLASWAKRCGGELCKLFLCGSGGRPADLLAVDDEIVAAVVLLEGEGAAIREDGFCQINSWFHFGLLLARYRQF